MKECWCTCVYLDMHVYIVLCMMYNVYYIYVFMLIYICMMYDAHIFYADIFIACIIYICMFAMHSPNEVTSYTKGCQ